MVPQHRPVYTAAFWWWRRRRGGVSGASTTTEQCQSAGRTGTRCMGRGGSGHKHTARPSQGRRGGGVKASGCLAGRMPSVLNLPPPRPQRRGRRGGGAGTIHTNTCSGSACVALRLANAWHMVLAAPAHGRALGHQQRCGTSPNPKSSAPTTAEARRRRGAGAEDTQQKRRGPSRAVHGT